MNEKDIAEMLKRMEWQKAKGHLKAMLETYHSEGDAHKEQVFLGAKNAVDEFIKEIEDWL